MEEIDYIIKTSVQQLLWLMCTGLQMIGQSVYDLYHDLARSNQSPLATMTQTQEVNLKFRMKWNLSTYISYRSTTTAESCFESTH